MQGKPRKGYVCGRCGRIMPYVEALVGRLEEPTLYLCHPDDPSLPDCYHEWSHGVAS